MLLTNKTAVRKIFHDHGKRVSKCALAALNLNFHEFCARVAAMHNGGHTLITSKEVNLLAGNKTRV